MPVAVWCRIFRSPAPCRRAGSAIPRRQPAGPSCREYENPDKECPGEGTRSKSSSHIVTARLYSRLDDVVGHCEPLLKKAAVHTHPAYKATMGSDTKGAVLIMCVNWGNLDLLMNFLRTACDKQIDIQNLIVFAADPKVEKALKAIGVLVFSHDALGVSQLERGSRSCPWGPYLRRDDVVLKLTCVYLVNALGYDLLFQDADLYCLPRPSRNSSSRRARRPLLTRPDIDTGFLMDDGARTSRFRTVVSEHGYYRRSGTTLERALLCETLVAHSGRMYERGTGVAVVTRPLSQVLGEFHALHALTVKILDKIEFPSEKQFHHNRRSSRK